MKNLLLSLCSFFIFSVASAQKVWQAELLLDVEAQLGEGPIWDHRIKTLYWVDIEQEFVHTFEPSTGKSVSYPVNQKVGTVVPTSSGKVILGLQKGIYLWDLKNNTNTRLAAPEADKPGNRLNDGKCDPRGRFWVGSMDLKGAPLQGSLYKYEAKAAAENMLDSVSISNGLVWTADGATMYYIDTPTRCVKAFDFDVVRGIISHQKVAFSIPDSLGYPDGMAIDENGNVWIGMWGGGCVSHWNPKTGQYLGKVVVPGAKNVTACAFGGKHLDQLYITTARQGLSAKELRAYSESGNLFVAKVGVKGLPASFFKE